MHNSVYRWVEAQVKARNLAKLDVLELGSLNVNGTVRDHFRGRYVGVDIVDGPGVDFVASSHIDPDVPHTWNGERHNVDVVVCCEMLEHDSDPNATFATIADVLKPNGVALVTTRSEGFPLHHEPDYWRFTHDDVAALAYTAGLEVESIEDDPQPQHPGVFAVLRRP